MKESFIRWNTIFAERIIFQETVFSVRHQTPVNGRKKNVIRRFAGKLIVRANVIFYMKTVAKIQNSEEKRK